MLVVIAYMLYFCAVKLANPVEMKWSELKKNCRVKGLVS
jgi:hypothetical protein